MNLTLVGTSRCDVPARETAGGIVAPLNAARTAQRAVPTRFRDSMRERFGEMSSRPTGRGRRIRTWADRSPTGDSTNGGPRFTLSLSERGAGVRVLLHCIDMA